jgi:cellulose synthase operon protein C
MPPTTLSLPEERRTTRVPSPRDREILRTLAGRVAPDDAGGRNNLGVLYYNKGMLEEAVEQFEVALGVDPALEVARRNLEIARRKTGSRERPKALEDRFLSHYHRAVAHRQQGRYEEALRELDRALAHREAEVVVQQARAEMLLVLGRSAEAATLYRKLLKGEPESPKLWNELGVCRHRRGDLPGAEAAYLRALEVDERYALAANNLGVVAIHAGERRLGTKYLRRALERTPELSETLCNLGLMALQEGRFKDAIAAYRKAIAAHPEGGPGWIGLGAVLIENGHQRQARNALTRGIEYDPNNAEARYRLAFVLTKLGDMEGALRETRRALELDPYFTSPHFRLTIELQFEYGEVVAPELDTVAALRVEQRVTGFAPDQAELGAIALLLQSGPPAAEEVDLSYAQARAYLAKGLYSRALTEVGRVVRAGGDPVEAALLGGDLYRLQGLEGESLERFDTALARLEGTDWSERHVAAWLGRAGSLLGLGQAEAASEAAYIVERMDPRNTEALRLAGEAYLARGEPEAAIGRFTRLLELIPDEPPALLRLGRAARAAGRLQEAREALERAVDLDPDLVAARLELGSLAFSQQRLEEAAAHAREALAVLPGYADAALLLAEAERRAGRLDDAIAAIADLLVEDAYHLSALERLASVLEEAGRVEDAARAYDRLARLDPGSRRRHGKVPSPIRRTA